MIETREAPSNGSSAKVRGVQEALNRLLRAGLRPDGKLGPQTVRAIRTFQQRHGLPADGAPGPRTEAAIRSALGQPAAPPGPGQCPVRRPVS